MEDGVVIKVQMNGTKKIEFPEPEYYVQGDKLKCKNIQQTYIDTKSIYAV